MRSFSSPKSRLLSNPRPGSGTALPILQAIPRPFHRLRINPAKPSGFSLFPRQITVRYPTRTPAGGRPRHLCLAWHPRPADPINIPVNRPHRDFQLFRQLRRGALARVQQSIHDAEPSAVLQTNHLGFSYTAFTFCCRIRLRPGTLQKKQSSSQLSMTQTQ